eukprot:1136552-Pelagomonas_calceolata.AAC.1
MDTKAKSSHTVDDVFRLGWESTSVMISKSFAVCVSWVVTRKGKEKKGLRRPGLAACIKERSLN